ncbi:MAG TPA: sigma-70 family RNA polymerase sigma factor [Polyangiaceae bacterium]|nr:sigma-70 family RNA polymerase sigma factor [Polyangiaceae bacterium]
MSVCAETPFEAPSPEGERLARESVEAAFTRLYAEQFERVYGLLARYGVSPADLEDLSQQVFSVVLSHKEEIRRLENPRAWVAAITVRIVHEYYRFRRVRKLKAWVVEHSWAGRATDESTPERETLNREATARVRRVLAQMSAKLRDALVLVELEELGTRDAAAILAVPHNTLRSRQRLARAEFQRLWARAERAEETR